MRAVFYGVGPAVIGIIAYSAYKLTRKTIGKDRLLWLVYLASAVATVITERELVWLVLASGLLVWLVKTPPQGSTAALALPLGFSLPGVPVASNETLWQIAVFFTEAGAFRFRKRAGHHSVSIRRRRYALWLVERRSIPRRRGGGDDHAGSRRHYGCIHRLPGRWIQRGIDRGRRDVSALLLTSRSFRRRTSRNTASGPASSPSSTA